MQNAWLRSWRGGGMQRTLVFPSPCMLLFLQDLQGTLHKASGLCHLSPITTCPHLSPPALLIAFYLLPNLLVTIAKIVKLFLEPLVMSVLLSGVWSRPYASGAARAATCQELGPGCSAGPTTISTATTTDIPACRSPRHRHFVLDENSLRLSDHHSVTLGAF